MRSLPASVGNTSALLERSCLESCHSCLYEPRKSCCVPRLTQTHVYARTHGSRFCWLLVHGTLFLYLSSPSGDPVGRGLFSVAGCTPTSGGTSLCFAFEWQLVALPSALRSSFRLSSAGATARWARLRLAWASALRVFASCGGRRERRIRVLGPVLALAGGLAYRGSSDGMFRVQGGRDTPVGNPTATYETQ